MANRKISQLTALTTPAAGDYLPIVDISEAAAANQNKRITIEELLRGAPDGTAAAPGIAFESDGGNGMFLGGTDILAFSTGGTQAVTIDASQRLGVGTSLPSGNLDVRGISGTTIIRAVGADSNGNADAEIFSTGTTGSSRLYFSDTAAQSGSITYAHSNNSFAFATNGSPAVTIDSSGRLLVGTSSDSGGALLQVNGNRIRVSISKTPASATDTGTTGEICWDANYIYVCTATNTWKRTAISTW